MGISRKKVKLFEFELKWDDVMTTLHEDLHDFMLASPV